MIQLPAGIKAKGESRTQFHHENDDKRAYHCNFADFERYDVKADGKLPIGKVEVKHE